MANYTLSVRHITEDETYGIVKCMVLNNENFVISSFTASTYSNGSNKMKDYKIEFNRLNGNSSLCLFGNYFMQEVFDVQCASGIHTTFKLTDDELIQFKEELNKLNDICFE